MKRFLLVALFAGGCLSQAEAQSIPRDDQPRFMVDNQEAGKKSVLMLTFGVSMSDCIKQIEVENLDSKRKYTLYPTLDNYYVRDSDMEEIYAKVPIGKFRKLVKKKEGLHTQITIVSKSGRRVFSGRAEVKMEGDVMVVQDTRTAAK